MDRDSFLADLSRGDTPVSDAVLNAAASISRESFIPITGASAYGLGPIPIDCGETMPDAASALRLVDSLGLVSEHRVLEVGTGSGYVTALMARLALHVTSIERYRRLVAKAETALQKCEITNVSFFHRDGSEGCEEAAPYDRILVHAAFPAPPRAYLEQMTQQSILVCAIGPGDGAQMLVRLQRIGSRFEREDLWPVRYQPIALGMAKVL